MIPNRVLGVDSTPLTGEWLGGWYLAIFLMDLRPSGWGYAIWTHMGQPLSIWGYALAPFRLGIWTSPFTVGDMDRPLSFSGYGLARFRLGITFCPSCPQTSFAICSRVEHWGQGVLHQVYLASGTHEGGWHLYRNHLSPALGA